MALLQVTVVGARGLELESKEGIYDPGYTIRHGKTKYLCQPPKFLGVRPKNSSPDSWKNFTWNFPLNQTLAKHITVKVVDILDDGGQLDLGEAKIDMQDLVIDQEMTKWQKLENCSSGEILLKLLLRDDHSQTPLPPLSRSDSKSRLNGDSGSNPILSPPPTLARSTSLQKKQLEPRLESKQNVALVGNVGSEFPKIPRSGSTGSLFAIPESQNPFTPLNNPFLPFGNSPFSPIPSPFSPQSTSLLPPLLSPTSPRTSVLSPLSPVLSPALSPAISPAQSTPSSLLSPSPSPSLSPLSSPSISPPQSPHFEMAAFTLKMFAPEEIHREELPFSRGAFSEVFRGKITCLNLPLVCIKDTHAKDQKAIDDWKKEVSLMSQTRSAYIAQVYGYSFNQAHLTIVMEYFPLGDLFGVLHKKSAEHRLSLIQRMKMARQCALGLCVLHNNKILHRDIKSMNILVSENYSCKLADFGCSKMMTLANGQMVNSAPVLMTMGTGTPLWMAPEVPSGNYSFPSDVYSLGLVLYEIFEKKLPDYDTSKRIAVLPEQFSSSSCILPLVHHNPLLRPTAVKTCFFLEKIIKKTIKEFSKILNKNSEFLENVDLDILLNQMSQQVQVSSIEDVDCVLAHILSNQVWVEEIEMKKEPSTESLVPIQQVKISKRKASLPSPVGIPAVNSSPGTFVNPLASPTQLPLSSSLPLTSGIPSLSSPRSPRVSSSLSPSFSPLQPAVDDLRGSYKNSLHRQSSPNLRSAKKSVKKDKDKDKDKDKRKEKKLKGSRESDRKEKNKGKKSTDIEKENGRHTVHTETPEDLIEERADGWGGSGTETGSRTRSSSSVASLGSPTQLKSFAKYGKLEATSLRESNGSQTERPIEVDDAYDIPRRSKTNFRLLFGSKSKKSLSTSSPLSPSPAPFPSLASLSSPATPQEKKKL